MWNSDKVQCILFSVAGIWEISRLPSPSDSRAHGDSKISNLPDKIWKSKRKFFFFFWLHQERKSGHSGKAFYFSDENPEKLMKGMLFYFLDTNLQSDSRVPIFLAIELQQCFLILCFYALHWPFGN